MYLGWVEDLGDSEHFYGLFDDMLKKRKVMK
jgi:hypothetical protein